MKNSILLLSLCFAMLTNAQPSELIQGAGIQISETSYDFGEITQTSDGEYVYCEFEVTNTGNEPLIISKCQGSCGCTTPECSKTPILPGQSTTIKVRYDSHRLGNFSKKVTIYSNAENEPEKTIRIKGMVLAS